MHWVQLIENTSSYQNFFVCIEMLLAAILLRFAFPYSIYRDQKDKGMQMHQIGSNLKDTLNPKDVVKDTIHNFSRTYQSYAQQGKVDENEVALDDQLRMSLHVLDKDVPSGIHEMEGESPSTDSAPYLTGGNGEIPHIKQLINKRSDQLKGHINGSVKTDNEKLTLLAEDSDEDEL